MKTKQIITAACLSLTLIAAGTILACAEETEQATTVTTKQAIVPTMKFTGKSVELSLEEAVKIMQTTGTAAEKAEINKKSADASARGYDEDYDSIRSALKAASGSDISTASYYQSMGSESTKKASQLSRDYAKAQGPRNYQAEMNNIESDTVQVYFGVLQAQEALTIAQDNLKVQQDLLSITKKKLSLGMVAKKDVLSAETAVTTAKKDVAAAETSLNNAKMNFNFMLGYPLMQKIVLTDSLQELVAPETSLIESIESALENRSEIAAADFNVKVNELLLADLKYRYPEYSSKYLKQYVGLLNAEKSYKDSFVQVEMDIRAKYMGLSDKKNSVAAAKATADNAAEMYRLAKISYDSGMNTLNDVQQAQLGAFNANLGLSSAILDYDLAVYEFKYAIGVGTATMPI